MLHAQYDLLQCRIAVAAWLLPVPPPPRKVT